MGRRGSFKAFIPPNPPDSFGKPANGHLEWTKPVVVDTTVNVDKAKERVKREANAGASATDHFIGVDTASQAVTITLPGTNSVAVGKIFLIKDEGGNAGTNNITIATTGNVKIDGASSFVLDSDYAAVNVYYNGTEWSVY